jgi:NhaA family Na+:H+ antiporter
MARDGSAGSGWSSKIHRWTPTLLAVPALVFFHASGADASQRPVRAGDPAWWLVGLFTLQGFVIWLFSHRRYLVYKDGELKPAFSELQEFSSYLLAGAVVAQLWIHGDPDSYYATVHDVLATLVWVEFDVSLHFLANEVLMAFFFGIAAKELSEAILLKDGALRGVSGLLPALACLGGVIGPAVVYRIICSSDMTDAWAVPCATDIAFAWIGARAIWGATHPAVTFLLALAVADDFIGMGLIAIFYPQRPFDVAGLLLLALGIGLAFGCNRGSRRVAGLGRWQAFVIPGALCWIGLHLAGLHAALALVFVVPFMPMRDRDAGFFAEEDYYQLDSINMFEKSHKPFVDIGLFYFGLSNAGVLWWGSQAWDQNSWAVFLGLGFGKTIGVSAFTVLGFLLLKLARQPAALPANPESGQQLSWQDVPLIGLLAAMGFTVALFIAEAAGGHPSLKLGALASFAFLVLAVGLGRLRLAREATPAAAGRSDS